MNNIEKNTIIAKWLGWKFNEYDLCRNHPFEQSMISTRELKFNTDMNWLYLCIEKIAEIEYNKNGSPKTLVQVLNTIRGINPIFTIEAVFNAILNYVVTN